MYATNKGYSVSLNKRSKVKFDFECLAFRLFTAKNVMIFAGTHSLSHGYLVLIRTDYTVSVSFPVEDGGR